MTLSHYARRLLLATLCCACVANVASAQSQGQPVSPRQLFAGPLLSVHAPDEEGWVIAGIAQGGIAFAKRGSTPSETYGAQVVVIHLEPTENGDALVQFVKQRIATMNGPPRFQETASEYRYHETRGYPCVDARVRFDDNAAVTPSGEQRLKLQVIALYCRHPIESDLGFFAAYSQRGPSGDVDIEDAARRYIDGVTVPEQPADPIR